MQIIMFIMLLISFAHPEKLKKCSGEKSSCFFLVLLVVRRVWEQWMALLCVFNSKKPGKNRTLLKNLLSHNSRSEPGKSKRWLHKRGNIILIAWGGLSAQRGSTPVYVVDMLSAFSLAPFIPSTLTILRKLSQQLSADGISRSPTRSFGSSTVACTWIIRVRCTIRTRPLVGLSEMEVERVLCSSLTSAFWNSVGNTLASRSKNRWKVI